MESTGRFTRTFIACSASALALAMLLAGALAHPAHAQVVDILDLHHNNSQGIPAPPYTIGTPVTVRGVVTVGVGTFTASYTDVYVQDATGGIMIYKPTVPYEFERGDSVTINGEIDHYRGMTEIVLDTYTLHASAAELPDSRVVHCYDVEHVFQPDYSEPNEGRLVRLNNVTWSGAWPSFSGPITLHDETGTCTLYIDGTTGIQNMPPPTGPFDVVGVVKQYAGYTPPYTSDYELLPRSAEDFYLLPGPQILVGPYETTIQHDNVTIHLETETETTAIVRYGLTSGHELGSVTDGISSTLHDILIPDLDAATIYHYEVTVEDSSGQTTTPDKLFCSGSAPGCTGEIMALFNKSVDYGLATHGQALGNQDLQDWIIARIDSTGFSIDVALYSFDLPDVADALIEAKDRGVRIRFVYDDRDPYQTEVQRLINNGIWVIDDSFGPNSGNGLMHHKLWVFDAVGGDPADQWVVTGSWNLTPQGTYTDAQNVVMIQDQALAQVCTVEFDEMWGSSIFLPNPDGSRFGTNKLDDTPKIFSIGGHEVRMYFAPSDPWLGALIDEVEEADYSINFCILSFTRHDLCNEMEERWMNVPAMAIRGVFDSGESGNQYSQYWPMHGDGQYAWDPPADVWLDAETGTLHHKYMIIDVDIIASDPVLATGSANWSTSAVNENDENHIIIHDPALANCYFQEFAERYHAAGGTGIPSSCVEPGSQVRTFFRAGPNPAPSGLRVGFTLAVGGEVTCDIYAPDGRLVDRILDRVATAPGEHVIHWRAPRDKVLGSGVYYLRLSAPEGTWNRRVTLVR